MLSHLSISNLAIIDSLEVDFVEGLQVLTGETGAGKSIIVQSLKLLLGGRAAADDLRTGCDSAEVEGHFFLPAGLPLLERLSQEGLAEGGELVVRRTLQRSGRGRAQVNGRTVPLGRLAELTRDLVAISGQHEHVQLTDEARHLDYLDAFGKLEERRQRVAEAAAAAAKAKAELAELVQEQQQRAEREDYLRFSLQQIRALDPQPEEMEKLENERSRLRHLGKISQGLAQSLSLVYDQEGCAVELLGKAATLLEPLAEVDSELEHAAEQAGRLSGDCGELGRELARLLQALPDDPGRLEQIEQRLGELRALARRHGGSLAAALEAARQMEGELARLENSEEEISARRRLAQEEEANARRLAGELSRLRAEAAGELSVKLQQRLRALAMKQARVQVDISRREELDPTGLDRVRLLLSANPGEEPKPLARVASGGELSRILLAFKAVFSGIDPAASYVFDEVDAGIGGSVAAEIGLQLRQVARDRQVICITHLPQIAASAPAHFQVKKSVSQQRARVEMLRLDENQRVEELARMLGGKKITDKAREHARELLALSGKIRPDF